MSKDEKVLVSKAELSRIESAMEDFYSLFKRTVKSECVPYEELYFAAAKSNVKSLLKEEAYEAVKEEAKAVQPDGWLCPKSNTLYWNSVLHPDLAKSAGTGYGGYDPTHVSAPIVWRPIYLERLVLKHVPIKEGPREGGDHDKITDQKILDLTEELARNMLHSFYGRKADTSQTLRTSGNKIEKECWQAARAAYLLLNDIDPLESVHNLEGYRGLCPGY